MSFKFIEAVQRLSPNFTKEEWGRIYDKVGTRLHLNQLRRTFVVLRDEDRPKTARDQPLSGANAVPSGPGVGRGRPGLRKRPADPILPTPSKSVRANNV